jgi:hypothetical protein
MLQAPPPVGRGPALHVPVRADLVGMERAHAILHPFRPPGRKRASARTRACGSPSSYSICGRGGYLRRRRSRCHTRSASASRRSTASASLPTRRALPRTTRAVHDHSTRRVRGIGDARHLPARSIGAPRRRRRPSPAWRSLSCCAGGISTKRRAPPSGTSAATTRPRSSRSGTLRTCRCFWGSRWRESASST